MDYLLNGGVIIRALIIFLILHYIAKSGYDKFKIHFHQRVEPEHFLPKEEIQNQKQLFYIIILSACLIYFIYLLETSQFLEFLSLAIFKESNQFESLFFEYDFSFLIFDLGEILLALYLSLHLDIKGSLKDLVIFLLLVPCGAIDSALYYLYVPTEFLLDEVYLFYFLDLVHSLSFLYFIRVYYKKFIGYTRNNALGKTIVLMFIVLIATTLITLMTEHVSVLEGMNMVSNAFASNGYLVLGTGTLGKINEIIIVWGGYLLSGIYTATLTATILIRYYNSKINEINEEHNRQLDELEELMNSGDSD